MWRNRAALRLALALSAPVLATAAEPRVAELGRYGADPDRVTVSGLSSGGYMAVQLGVAYSSTFTGIGVIAGGPYACAHTGRGLSVNLNRALGPCMAGAYTFTQRTWRCWFPPGSCPAPERPDPKASLELARRFEKEGTIDPLARVSRQRIFLLSGTDDNKLVPAVVDALHQFYAGLMPAAQIRRQNVEQLGHTFPTDTVTDGNACSRSASPYISNCKYDGAGTVLEHVHGALKPRNDGTALGALIEFDQSKFFPANVETGMAGSGYVYVPKTCTTKERRCTVHVALHGCRQTAAEIGDKFVRTAGYNRWADTNNIIVLYPQVGKSRMATNPRDCWDWWGYTGTAWLVKRAPQMQAIVGMVNHLKSPAQ